MHRTSDAPVWIKMSADYKLGSDDATVRACAIALIRACVAHRPKHLIWGSDWPHTSGGPARAARPFGKIEPFRGVDSHAIPNLFADCGLSESQIAGIMCDNPARLLKPGKEA